MTHYCINVHTVLKHYLKDNIQVITSSHFDLRRYNLVRPDPACSPGGTKGWILIGLTVNRFLISHSTKIRTNHNSLSSSAAKKLQLPR